MTHKLYDALGLNKNNNPSADEIKKAYKVNAMKYHPDKNKGDPNAEAKFKEITNAYEILSDENKRAAYNRDGDEHFNKNNNNHHQNNAHDIFEHFFRERRGGMFGGGNPFGFDFEENNDNKRCGNTQKTFNISLEDCYNGYNKGLTINITKFCHECLKKCQNCNGSGIIKHVRSMGVFHQVFSAPCDKCDDGYTNVSNKGCTKCKGNGKYNSEINVRLTLPKGISSGHKTCFKDLGEQSKNPNQTSGDLIFVINVSNDFPLKRNDNDLYYTCDISFIDSIIGTEIEIPHFNDNTIKVNTNSWGVVYPGKKYMIQNKGMPIVNSSSFGNLFVEFNIKYPKIKNNGSVEALKKALEEVFYNN